MLFPFTSQLHKKDTTFYLSSTYHFWGWSKELNTSKKGNEMIIVISDCF